jgi:hypothetical protein
MAPVGLEVGVGRMGTVKRGVAPGVGADILLFLVLLTDGV